jgi:hypothetical protein
VLGRAYFTRQILTLLKFAQSTADPKFAALLLDKAVDLKSQAEEVPPAPDIGPHPPDVEHGKVRPPQWPSPSLPVTF